MQKGMEQKMINSNLFLGINSSNLAEILQKGSLFGRIILTDSLTRGFEFGDIVIGLPSVNLNAKLIYTSKQDDHRGILPEEREFIVNSLHLNTSLLKLYYQLMEGEEIPLEIQQLEKELSQHFQLKINFLRQPNSKSSFTTEEFEMFKKGIDELELLVLGAMKGNLTMLPAKRGKKQ
jgi:hypothetical protein